ncbi:MAG: alpha/beta fold hydrolase [Acetobacteraceae bacterium]|nr:alpha/beta fold hydrolase [Acetobacteraceae bacterium]
MLLPLEGRKIAYDLIGSESAPVVCMTHSLASDSGMWAEQVPPLLAAGFQVLRIDMRGHGGSDPVGGDYTMSQLAADVAAVLDALDIGKVHFIGLSIGGMLGQAFALEHGGKLASAMWCDTRPSSPGDAQVWNERMKIVRDANSLAPLADPTIERWLTDAVKQRSPSRWKQIRDTIVGTSPQGYLGCSAAIQDFDFASHLPSVKAPVLVVCGSDDAGTPPAENRRIAELVPGGRYQEIANARHFPNVEHPETFNRIMMDWFQTHREKR